MRATSAETLSAAIRRGLGLVQDQTDVARAVLRGRQWRSSPGGRTARICPAMTSKHCRRATRCAELPNGWVMNPSKPHRAPDEVASSRAGLSCGGGESWRADDDACEVLIAGLSEPACACLAESRDRRGARTAHLLPSDGCTLVAHPATSHRADSLLERPGGPSRSWDRSGVRRARVRSARGAGGAGGVGCGTRCGWQISRLGARSRCTGGGKARDLSTEKPSQRRLAERSRADVRTSVDSGPAWARQRTVGSRRRGRSDRGACPVADAGAARVQAHRRALSTRRP